MVCKEEAGYGELFRMCLRGRRFFFWLIPVFMVISVLYCLSLPNLYTSTVTFLPHFRGLYVDPALKNPLAAEVGYSRFVSFEEVYFKIARSNQLLDEVISRDWRYNDAGDTKSIVDLLGISPGDGSPHGREKAFGEARRKLLDDVVIFVRSKDTGLLSLKVSVPDYPLMAAEIAGFMSNWLQEYIAENRLFRVDEEYERIVDSITETQAGIRIAESSIADFLVHNASFLSSPVLTMEYGRLDRELVALLEVKADCEERLSGLVAQGVGREASVAILDKASRPTAKSFPFRSLTVLASVAMAFVLSALLSIFTGLVDREA